MQRLKKIEIENFKSIGEIIEIIFPENQPTILLGENNSGKSNIIKAIELMFGEYHPKYKKLENYDYYQRDDDNDISIKSHVSEFNGKLGRNQEFSCSGFNFNCSKTNGIDYCAIQSENGEENQYVGNNLREELICITVNSEQNLSYQLSYASKYTLLSKVTRAFHDKLIKDDEKIERLKSLFEDIKSTFLEVTEFNEFNQTMSDIAGEMLSNMTHALEFDFSAYDPSNYFKTLKVHPSQNGNIRAFEELGTGQQQILALCFAHAYAKSFHNQGLIFILDEPESNLHPLAQKWLAKNMFKMATDGLQIILTTHSPYFIDLNYLNGIYLVQKTDSTTEVKNVSGIELSNFCNQTGGRISTQDTIIPFYASHSRPHILNGFFARKIILTEGETEEFSLLIFFEGLDFDLLKEGIAVIGVGGKGNLSKWWRFYKSYNIPVFVCFDNDSGDDSSGVKRKDALKAIGIPEEEVSSLLTTENWNISNNFCIFGNDYEQTMRGSFSRYVEFETTEIARLGAGSKPIIAKSVAGLIIKNKEEEIGWEKMRLLINKIKTI